MEKWKESSSHRKIAFIACSKTKNNSPCTAEKMYQGELFKKSLKYCKNNYDIVFILSAKYGLLELNDFIEPYEETLNNKTEQEKKQWAEIIKTQMKEKNIFSSEVDILAGKNYYKYLNYNNIPLADKKGIGYQLQWLSEQLKNQKGFSL